MLVTLSLKNQGEIAIATKKLKNFQEKGRFLPREGAEPCDFQLFSVVLCLR